MPNAARLNLKYNPRLVWCGHHGECYGSRLGDGKIRSRLLVKGRPRTRRYTFLTKTTLRFIFITNPFVSIPKKASPTGL
jgi:hypothetical protein